MGHRIRPHGPDNQNPPNRALIQATAGVAISDSLFQNGDMTKTRLNARILNTDTVYRGFYRLQRVTLEQLTAYLYKIETSNNMVSIRSVSISKTSRPSGFLDATLNVETFEKI